MLRNQPKTNNCQMVIFRINNKIYLYDNDMDQHFHLPHIPLPASARQTFLLQYPDYQND